MGKLTFILGGARSGKSACAQRLAENRVSKVLFIATATAADDEMAVRIAKHRKGRPPGWTTREIPYGIAASLKTDSPEADIVLLDCITLLISNLLLQDGEAGPDEAAANRCIETEINGLLEIIRNGQADWIVISNEVGLGLVPPYPLGRMYRDLLGRVNQQLAAHADEVLWMVAGIPVPIQK